MSDFRKIPLFPLKTVLFPGMLVALHIFEDRYKRMVARCMTENMPFGIVLINNGSDTDSNVEFHTIGTAAKITQVDPYDDGRMSLLASGTERFKIFETTNENPYLTGTIKPFPWVPLDPARAEQLEPQVKKLFRQYLHLNAEAGRIDPNPVTLPSEISAVAFHVANILDITPQEKQSLLATASLQEFLELEITILKRELDFMRAFLDQSPSWLDNQSFISPN